MRKRSLLSRCPTYIFRNLQLYSSIVPLSYSSGRLTAADFYRPGVRCPSPENTGMKMKHCWNSNDKGEYYSYHFVHHTFHVRYERTCANYQLDVANEIVVSLPSIVC